MTSKSSGLPDSRPGQGLRPAAGQLPRGEQAIGPRALGRFRRPASGYRRSVLGVGLLVAGTLGCAPETPGHLAINGPASAVTRGPVTVGPDPVTLGTLEAGRAAHATVSLHNPGSEALTLDRVESSCACVRMTPLPVRIDPRRSVDLTVTFDPREEPDFRGAMTVDLTGWDAAGRQVFRTRVELEVQSGPAPAPSAPRPEAGPPMTLGSPPAPDLCFEPVEAVESPSAGRRQRAGPVQVTRGGGS